MSQHGSQKPTPLCSWPPSPSLLRLHLLTRSILLLTDILGFSLLLAVGVGEGNASAIVAGTFLGVSMVVGPIIMLWNRKLLKRVTKTKTNGSYQQLDNTEDDGHAPRMGVHCLRSFTFLEGFGVLAYIGVYPPLMANESRDYWGWGNDSHYYATYSYGSVSVLIAILLHTFLFMTQALQLRSARRNRTSLKMVCPHCNHAMTQSPSASSHSAHDLDTPRPSSVVENQEPVDDDMLGESLVDARVSVDMSAGQETGTTLKTPRVSESAARAGEAVANEVGEGEGDSLIRKSG